MKIGSIAVMFVQGVVMFFSGLWLLIFSIILFIKPSMSGLFGLIAGVGIVTGFNALYLKLREIEVVGQSINIRNLLFSDSFKRENFIAVKKTSLSPFVFKLELSDEKAFFFATDISTFFTSMDSDHAINKFSDQIAPRASADES